MLIEWACIEAVHQARTDDDKNYDGVHVSLKCNSISASSNDRKITMFLETPGSIFGSSVEELRKVAATGLREFAEALLDLANNPTRIKTSPRGLTAGIDDHLERAALVKGQLLIEAEDARDAQVARSRLVGIADGTNKIIGGAALEERLTALMEE